ncbi:bifunctional [glutamate--ammonia ligase]-adenylyl-L-tyrosine phosphorylase/[glutamate--ammonia-ligase] adenylyltransferase [Candidatus Auribacterota bacterium]
MAKKRINLKEVLNPGIEESVYTEVLAEYGFKDGRKFVDCIRSIVTDEAAYEHISIIFPTLVDEFSKSPDPDTALVNFDRFVSAVFSKMMLFTALAQKSSSLRLLLKLFGTSQFLSDALIRNPEYFDWMTDYDVLNMVKDRETVLREMGSSVLVFSAYEARLNSLRRFKRREMLRIGVKDIMGISRLEETVLELSNLGDAVLETSYRIADDEMKKKYGVPKEKDGGGNIRESDFAVISMGKLGGEELNYSSDIDVLFVYSDDGTTDVKGRPKARSVSNQEYFTRLSEMILTIVGANTKEGYVFRIDTRLRPEGKSGALVRTLDSYEEYYSSWGEAWERMALIKARFSAGARDLGEGFIDMIRPFVYQRSLSQSAIDEVRDVKRRIDKEVSKRGRKYSEVKLGYGGIREIEFTVQVVQLIFGGKNEKIRSNNSLKAIYSIDDAGILKGDEAARLAEAYRFLRTVEHFLQIEHELQLHYLPEDPAELDKLARRLGYKDEAGRVFMDAYRSHADFVHAFHTKFFSSGEGEEDHDYDILIGKENADEAARFCADIGFKDGVRAVSNIRILADGPEYMHVAPATVRTFKRFLGDLVNCLKSSPDPDMALNNFERFVSSQGARSVFYKLLDENRNIIKLLISLGGNSQYLSDILAARPDILSQIVMPGALDKDKTSGDMSGEITRRIGTLTDYNEKINELRRYKNGELVRVGVRDILCLCPIKSILADLSNIADALLSHCYVIGREELEKKYGKPVVKAGKKRSASEFAVFGMGKLGGREPGYSSDLDIIFVYSGDGETESDERKITNQEFYSKLAQKIIKELSETTSEGFLYKIDTRLRPGGMSEVMVPSLEGYRNYYGTRSMTWEKQALTKIRFICGDEALAGDFMDLISKYVYGSPLTSGESKEIFDMRMKMEKERVKPGERDIHIKLGTGGIVDIEFIAQVLQLRHGNKDKGIRGSNTLEAMRSLKDKKFLSTGDFMLLNNGYVFMRMIENKLRIVSNHSVDTLPKDEEKLRMLIKRLGSMVEGPKEFVGEYNDFTGKIRKIFKNIVAEGGS